MVLIQRCFGEEGILFRIGENFYQRKNSTLTALSEKQYVALVGGKQVETFDERFFEEQPQ